MRKSHVIVSTNILYSFIESKSNNVNNKNRKYPRDLKILEILKFTRFEISTSRHYCSLLLFILIPHKWCNSTPNEARGVMEAVGLIYWGGYCPSPPQSISGQPPAAATGEAQPSLASRTNRQDERGFQLN